jgi:hypothetical protein
MKLVIVGAVTTTAWAPFVEKRAKEKEEVTTENRNKKRNVNKQKMKVAYFSLIKPIFVYQETELVIVKRNSVTIKKGVLIY